MKKPSSKFISCFIAVLFFMHLGFFHSKAQYAVDYELKTQMDVDSFKLKFPNGEVLADQFHIGPSKDITDLSPLSSLKIKSEILWICENLLLENLDGLEGVDSTRFVRIKNNPVLKDVAVLDDVMIASDWGIIGISIYDNPMVNSCCFTTKPQYNCANISIRNNGIGCDNIEQVLTDCTNKNIQNCKAQNAFNKDTLRANNVEALINSNGGLFFDQSYNSTYRIPAGSNKNSLSTVNLWMGGIDESGDIRVAAQTFGIYTGADFWPGPIAENYQHCSKFDRFWNTSKASVDTFLNNYIENNGDVIKDVIPKSILKYPAKNNPHFDEFPLPENVDLAPYVDTNNDGNYNPLDGDYPAIKGDQNIWNVFSDLKYIDRDQGCNDPIKMQVSSMAYASASDDYIDNATFYDYTLSYFGSDTLKDFYFGIFAYTELGNYQDDFVGCNVEEKMAYVYNADDFDDYLNGYGDEIPAIGIKFIKSLIDEKNNEVGLAAFVNFWKRAIYNIGRPVNSEGTYNYLKGLWKDGTPLTYGGNGTRGDIIHPFMYSDPPNDENGWSEYTTGNTGDSKRFVMSVGPVTLSPGEVQTVTIGILWEPNVGGGNPDLSPLFEISKQIETDIDSVFALPCNGNIIWYENLDGDGLGNPNSIKYACEQPEGFVAEKDNLMISAMELTISPNPTSDFIIVSFGKKDSNFHEIKIYNSLGQLVYQNRISGNKNQLKIDVSNYENGIYYLEVRGYSSESLRTSFVVQ